MSHPLLLLLALLAAATLAFWLWTRFTRWEVAQNAAMITANGSADDLRKGFHQRRSWVRFWPWLGLSLLPALPPLPIGGGWGVGLLAFAAEGLLLAGYFARYFTPLLNVARGLPEFRASGDSASWPDAAAWKETRAIYEEYGQFDWPQAYADSCLKHLLTRAWMWCRLAAGVLALASAYAIMR